MSKIQVVIFGPTGTAGSAVVHQCLRSEQVARVVVVTRNSTGLKDSRLLEVLHQDFADMGPITQVLRECDACLYCLGVSQLKVRDEDLFFRITHDFPLATARALHEVNPDAAFCFLSGQGADPSLRSKVRFARAKGAAENSLTALGMKYLYIFRPGYIHPLHQRPGRPLGERFAGMIYPLMKRLMPKFVISAATLADGMIHAAMHHPGQTLFANTGIKKIASRNP